MYLWPRFHLSVVETLSACSPEVIELHVDMTDPMRTIQTAVLDLVKQQQQHEKAKKKLMYFFLFFFTLMVLIIFTKLQITKPVNRWYHIKPAIPILFLFPSGRYKTSLLSICKTRLSLAITGVNPSLTYLIQDNSKKLKK